MAAEKQESGTRSLGGEAGNGDWSGQAAEAVEGLRSLVDQASRAVRDLTQASQQWTQIAQERAHDLGQELRGQGKRALAGVSPQAEELRGQGKRALAGVSQQAEELRNQGEQAVAGVSRQVEQNPLTSLAIAFALGYLLASVTRR